MNYIGKINKLFSIKVNKEVEGAEVWLLTWVSYVNKYSFIIGDDTDTVVRAKAFLNENDAKKYADSLEKANELLENNTRLRINIEKQK